MSSTKLDLTRFAVSPCSTPDLPLDEVLSRYSELGYRKFEVFTSWAKSSFDIHGDPAFYLAKGRQHGMIFSSMHLPPIRDDRDESLKEAIAGVRFAKAIGADIVLYKASSRPNYIAAARAFLDAIEGLGVTPVLQNHYGTPITTLEDFREVIDGIADPRMKTLLEVGHFHKAGVTWPEGYQLLAGSIALVHIKDQIGGTPVPFGEGEIDLPGLFQRLNEDGYRGDVVVEMEVCRNDIPRTLELLSDARQYIHRTLEALPA